MGLRSSLRARRRHRRGRRTGPRSGGHGNDAARGGRGLGRTARGRSARNRPGPGVRRLAEAGSGRRRDERRRGQRGGASARRPERDRRDLAPVAGPGGSARRASVLLAGRSRRRSQYLPCARSAARHARPARGVPSSRRPTVRRELRGGGDAESLHSLQRRFRFDELLSFVSRAGAETLWTGHYARVVERDGTLLVARGADARKDQSYMLATLSSDALARVRFPLGAQSKAETRQEAARAGLAAAGRAESQEACFLGAVTTEAFSSATVCGPRTARSSTRTGTCSAARRVHGDSPPGSVAVSEWSPTGRSTCCGRTGRRTRSSSAPASRSRFTVSSSTAASTFPSLVAW